MSSQCIFCRIAAGELGTQFIHEDEHCVAFHDLNPQAPTHVLLIPKRHIENVAALADADAELMCHLMLKVRSIAEGLGIAKTGFRVVANSGPDGGQSVDHLHVHILGGRHMRWPPG